MAAPLYPPIRQNVGPTQPRRLWVCLEIVSENSKQESSIQRIIHSDSSQVELGNMTMLAEADHRCRLRVLLSTSSSKPLKPGMILGEWLFSFGVLMMCAGSNNRLKLDIRHNSFPCSVRGSTDVHDRIGSLCFTVTPVPDFSAIKHAQMIVGQFPEPHPSNLSARFPTLPYFSPTENSGDKYGKGSEAPDSQPYLTSVLDLTSTFSEPDEYGSITTVFRVLKFFIFKGVRLPVRYIHSIRYRRRFAQLSKRWEREREGEREFLPSAGI